MSPALVSFPQTKPQPVVIAKSSYLRMFLGYFWKIDFNISVHNFYLAYSGYGLDWCVLVSYHRKGYNLQEQAAVGQCLVTFTGV
ncbi:hypothetical protein VP01_1268g4 [Puccinia sorghi]|uniref:Uncharacterized protein n=1 Tax=Puccinia sorghi TaxID=27349 RepID=A0A0L6VQJ1_9BASI|nr:hypothetical protein VP01_1268g4 [Puccinia sorghi]